MADNEDKILDLTKKIKVEKEITKKDKKSDIKEKKPEKKKGKKPKELIEKKENKKEINEKIQRILIVIMLIFGLILFLSGLILLFIKISYYVYQNTPGKTENPNSTIEGLPLLTFNSLDGVRQFFPNMKFNHNSISYSIDIDCTTEQKDRIVKAFDDLTSLVEVIDFHITSLDDPDIEVICSSQEPASTLEDSDFFIVGEGGAKEVIQTGRYNIINDGLIYLYPDLHGSPKCSWSNVELHEIIHVLGFNHSTNTESLMYPILNS